MSRRLFTTLALAALLAHRASAQQASDRQATPPTFPAQVEQVTVDVVVTDRSGQPVTDLKRENLEILEDGARQTIASFDLFQVQAPPVETPAPAAPPPPPRVSTNTDAEDQRGRTFVIVFDDVHLRAYTAQQARGAIAEFLKKETRQGDRVTLLAATGSVWWTARMEAGRAELLDLVKRLQGRVVPDLRKDWISDYEAMRINIFHDNAILDRVQRRFETYGVMTMTEQSTHVRDMMAVEDPVVTTRAAEVYYAAKAYNQVTLGALERALAALAPVRGRKSVVLVSEGFVYDTHLLEFKRIIDSARRVNAAIYFINSKGLDAMPDAISADQSTMLPSEDLGFAYSQEAETTEGSESLAADSGGFTVRNSNDLAAGMKRISDETQAYYLVGYNPTNTARDGAFRKIEVRVPGRRGLTIRARKGYYAPSDVPKQPPPKPGTDPVFQAALDSPYQLEDVPLRMTHYLRDETTLDRARVFLAAEVDIRRLGLQEKDGKAEGALQYLMVAVSRDGGPFSRFDQTLQLSLLPEEREQFSRTWLPVVQEMELESGRYRAKMVVRDKASGRMGTVIHDFDVPDLKPFRVSTPVLSDVREQTADGRPGDRLAILARREFAQGASLFCQLDVYRAVKEEASGMPRVSMGYEVRRSDGTVLTRDPASLIRPGKDGGVSRLVGFSLQNASLGDYELRMKVRDEFSGETRVLREPFRVVAP
ncbi:MAG TPA: VWA domain-containing protein [Vicinamibacteria bacterium]|nr:VWA domain-containing protein [Vicinamibacteria bacterium]